MVKPKGFEVIVGFVVAQIQRPMPWRNGLESHFWDFGDFITIRPPNPRVSIMQWFVVHTKPRQEQRALENLQRQGFAAWLPMLSVQKLRRGRLEKVVDHRLPIERKAEA